MYSHLSAIECDNVLILPINGGGCRLELQLYLNTITLEWKAKEILIFPCSALDEKHITRQQKAKKVTGKNPFQNKYVDTTMQSSMRPNTAAEE